MSDIESIVGRYLNITVDGRAYRIFYEEAGSGIPLFFTTVPPHVE